jgi:enamine deaminase RidA (YjgF/YER057c/UK114 family)
VSTPPNSDTRIIRPSGWAPPRGYSDGIVANGQYLTLAGQIGWNPTTCEIETDDFAAQTEQALRNIVALLAEAGAEPQHLVRLTWFVTSRDEYNAARKAIGAAYREVIGTHFPPMTVVVVAGLLDPRAKVEIEATAVVPTTIHP